MLTISYIMLCFQVKATDKDVGPNANVTYGFMTGTQTRFDCLDNQAEEFPFEIDILSGNISVSQPFVILCSKYSAFGKACDNPVVTDNRSDKIHFTLQIRFFILVHEST